MHRSIGTSLKGSINNAVEFDNFDKAVIVTGDGDFYCLVDYLLNKNKLQVLFVPNEFRFSTLFKEKRFIPYIKYINRRKDTLEYHKKERSP